MTEILMPRLSDTMEEGTIARWLKKPGDTITRGDIVAEVETDKATMDLVAYDSGILQQIIVEEGAIGIIGSPVAIIGDSATPTNETNDAPAPAAVSAPLPAKSSPATQGSEGQIRTSPLARSIATRAGISLGTISGSGPSGRIVRADVEKAISNRGISSDSVKPTSARQTNKLEDVDIPLSALRRVTAERLSASALVPQFSLTVAVDIDALLQMRSDINGALIEGTPKVSVTDLIVKACAVTLVAHPEVNASWAGDHISRRSSCNIGVAVAITDGLVVPVVKNCENASLLEISEKARDLFERARNRRLTPDEMQSGTFTISNLGPFGIEEFTAIVNPPEAAILAVGAGVPTPVVRNDQVVTRTIMKLTVAVDHRVIDGAMAAAFLADLKTTLEAPIRMLI